MPFLPLDLHSSGLLLTRTPIRTVSPPAAAKPIHVGAGRAWSAAVRPPEPRGLAVGPGRRAEPGGHAGRWRSPPPGRAVAVGPPARAASESQTLRVMRRRRWAARASEAAGPCGPGRGRARAGPVRSVGLWGVGRAVGRAARPGLAGCVCAAKRKSNPGDGAEHAPPASGVCGALLKLM